VAQLSVKKWFDLKYFIFLWEGVMGKNKKFFENKKHIKETKIGTKEHNNRQNVNICIGNLDTNKER